MHRLVLDTNVVLSALLWGGAPRVILTRARAGSIELFTSVALVTELAEVLQRPKFAERLSQLQFSPAHVVDAYLGLALVVVPESVPRTSPDPDDDMVLATAAAARADLILSGDQHLLALRTFRGIPIRNVADALTLLR